ncbi:hypothetical protein CR513_18180, partial [Mucuna pruriens]
MTHATPWYTDICNILVASTYPHGASKAYKDKLGSKAKYYIWDDLYLWRMCNDQVIRKCIMESEIKSILHFYHLTNGGGHYGSMQTTQKVLNYGFGVPKALINDQGIHFCNLAMAMLLEKYGMKMANPHQNDGSHLLEDAPWAHRTAYQTPLGMPPYQIVFGKACHLSMEIKHRAY